MPDVAGPNGAPASPTTAQGPTSIVQLPTPVTGTIAASGTLDFGLFTTGGYPHLAVGAKMNQAGSIVAQRYLDSAGAIPQGAALTQALTANTEAILDNNDGKVFQSVDIQIVNTGSAAATVANCLALLVAK